LVKRITCGKGFARRLVSGILSENAC